MLSNTLVIFCKSWKSNGSSYDTLMSCAICATLYSGRSAHMIFDKLIAGLLPQFGRSGQDPQGQTGLIMQIKELALSPVCGTPEAEHGTN